MQKLSAEEALIEMSTPSIVSQRLLQAFKTYEEMESVKKDNFTQMKLDQLINEAEKKAIIDKAAHDDMENISDKISSIQKTVLFIDQKMDLAKKRTARNFGIGVAISLSSIAIGVSGLAARFGWFDSHNEVATAPHNRKRFVSTPLIEKEKTTEVLLTTPKAITQVVDVGAPTDVVRLSLSEWGPYDPASGRKMIDVLLSRRIVKLPLKNSAVSICLEPNMPFLCNKKSAEIRRFAR